MQTGLLWPSLAQTPQTQPNQSPDFMQALPVWLPSLVGAIAILIIGWILAVVVSAAVRSLLKRTDLDNRIAAAVTGQDTTNINTEKLASTIVFWVILIIAIVAFLDALNLNTVSEPLNNFLNQIFAYLPRLGSAAVLIGVAWLLATIARALVIRIANSFNLDQRLNPDDAPGESQFLLSETLGNALYWFIFLFFLPLVLGVLDLQGPLQPVQNLLNSFLEALPRLVEAVVIAAVGWFIARIVRGIVTNLLSAAGADRLGAKVGLTRTTGMMSLSGLVGTVVYVLILIPTAIAALDALRIEAISGPASAMLNQFLSAIPQIFTAALILVLAFLIGQFVAELVTNLLTGLGFNNVFRWLGFSNVPTAPTPPPVVPPTSTQFPTDPTVPVDPTAPPTTSTSQLSRTPSEVMGLIAEVGIMLFAVVAATNILNIPALTSIVSGLMVVSGQVLVGVVIFAVGLFLANLAFNLIASSGNRQSRILAQTARIAVIALVSAMALQQMGIANDIVNLAFGLLLGAIAVAIALAFGLGGRDIAAEQIREWLSSFKSPQ
ncbi:MAG: mechanosensitive ion channel [Kaiparowitsia implicata GSE-PSE-MK54-09C]|nr:mechanosensitive ion channel [Kaiparowitsia implicata GSE-PSE-MK54-09C]